MLSVLKFKKSLFAGVLDGGEADIRFGGTRLSKFMQTVEETTKSIPAAQPGDTEGESERTRKRSVTVAAAPSADPWSGLVQTGLAFLQNLSAVANGAQGGNSQANPFVTRDEKTGAPYLKLPMPDAQTLQQLMTALSALVPKS